MSNKAGLNLSNDVSLSIDWTTLGEKLFKSVTRGFKAYNGDIKGGIDAVFALLGAAKTIKQEVPLGARALELILVCFAWSFDSLRANGHLNEEKTKEAAKKAIDTLKKRTEAGNLSISYDFFEQPSTAAPYILLRDEFVCNREAFRASTSETAELVRERFDSAFRSAIWAIWTDRSQTFEELAGVLDSPSARTADFERQWRTYRQVLANQFHVLPVFGQEETKVSLGELFTPLRCFWREMKELDENEPTYTDGQPNKQEIQHVRWLQEELIDWLDSDDENDWLRLIGGGPGSGKSTSAKAFAARIAERIDLRTLFIPLQHLGFSGRLRDEINRYFRDRTGSPFDVGPLERKYLENGPRLVLIFDGLDEIARPGESADAIAADMMDWIRELRSELVGDRRVKHRILVTGRMPSFQAAQRKVNRQGKEALEVLDLLPQDSRPRKPRDIAAAGMVSVKGDKLLLEADHRSLWWERYSLALGKVGTLPEGITERKLEELTAEPLLCYLLALSGYLESNTDEAAENRNLVYRQLLHDVWERAWGGGRAGSGRDLSKEDFDKLFETMALAAWHGGDERVATYDRFKNALSIMGSNKVFEKFKAHEGDNLSNLAVNFYLKRVDERERGFEFTHKSFGEYLTARALVRKALDIGDLSDRYFDAALSEWMTVSSQGKLTNDLLDFILDEGKFISGKRALSAKKLLERIMVYILENGWPLDHSGSKTCLDIAMQQERASTVLLALLQSFAGQISKNSKFRLIGKSVNKKIDLTKLIYLVQPNSGSVSRRIFSSLSLKNTSRVLDVTSHISLDYSDMEKANFSLSTLAHINFSNSKLRSAGFHASTIAFCLFNDVDLRNVDFGNACIRSSCFKNADLRNSKFRDAKLISVSFEGANLSKVDFSRLRFSSNQIGVQSHNSFEFQIGGIDNRFQEANLEGANFSHTAFESVSFAHANARKANFKQADLSDADFSGADLENVDFSGANLKNAKFSEAKLDGAIFDGANTNGSDLTLEDGKVEFENAA